MTTATAQANVPTEKQRIRSALGATTTGPCSGKKRRIGIQDANEIKSEENLGF